MFQGYLRRLGVKSYLPLLCDFLFYSLWSFLSQSLSLEQRTFLGVLSWKFLELSLLYICFCFRGTQGICEIALRSPSVLPAKGSSLCGKRGSAQELLTVSILPSFGVHSDTLPFLFNDFSEVQLIIFWPLHIIFLNPLYIHDFRIFFSCSFLSPDSCS